MNGPSIVRFKFVEGTSIRLDQNQKFYSATGTLTPTQQSELDAINALNDMPRERAFDQTDAELLSMKTQAEQASGYEMPDLTLWFEGLVQNTFVNPASSDPTVCAAMASRLQWLNSLSVVETAIPMRALSLPVFPSPSPSVDIAPATQPAIEPGHLGVFPGLDSPITVPWLSAQFTPGWRGQGAAVVDVENNVPSFTHEKVNFYTLPGGQTQGDMYDAAHALAAMSTVFGSAFSGNNESAARYGSRGFVPNVSRGFSPTGDTCFFWSCSDSAEAVLRAAQQIAEGDVILTEIASSNSSLVDPWVQRPIETESDVYDSIHVASALGTIVLEAAGNNGRLIDGIVNVEPDSGALLVGANSTTSPLARSSFSNYGSRVVLNAWGSHVVVAGTPSVAYGTIDPNPPPAGTNVQGQQYYDNFGGTSSALAVATGAIAQYTSIFRYAFGHPMGHPGFDRAQTPYRVATERGTPVSNVGIQPEVVRTVVDSILVTRFPACSWLPLRDPHARDAIVTVPASVATDTGVSWSPTGCAYRATTYNSPGVTVDEMEFGSDRGPVDLGYNPDNSFTIEAYVRISTDSAWQGVIAKENPRNYWFGVTPTGGLVPGALHFSYQPAGSNTLCPLYGTRRVDDGASHQVAVRFDRRNPSAPVIRFFVDGVLDTVSNGAPCGAAAPAASPGSGSNTAIIGTGFRAGSMVGNVRVSHRFVGDDEILFHFQNGST